MNENSKEMLVLVISIAGLVGFVGGYKIGYIKGLEQTEKIYKVVHGLTTEENIILWKALKKLDEK